MSKQSGTGNWMWWAIAALLVWAVIMFAIAHGMSEDMRL